MTEASCWLETEFAAGQDLGCELARIKRTRRTGALTVEFREGEAVGEFTWKERLNGKKGPYDPSERHLVTR